MGSRREGFLARRLVVAANGHALVDAGPVRQRQPSARFWQSRFLSRDRPASIFVSWPAD